MKGACVIWLSPTEQMPGHQSQPCVQAWHGIAGHSREGALSETWPHISNFTLAEQSKLIMSISSCWLVETPSRTVMLVSCSTNPGRKYLSTFCRTFLPGKVCARIHAPQSLNLRAAVLLQFGVVQAIRRNLCVSQSTETSLYLIFVALLHYMQVFSN